MTSDDDRLQLGLKYTEERLRLELKSQEQQLRSEFKIEIERLRTKIAESQFDTFRYIFVIANVLIVIVFAILLKIL